MLRIGCYTIALNEEKFARRWVETTKEADYALVADTGSTDQTLDILSNCEVDVVSIAVGPWRFDDARNAALNLLPADLDVAISLDMDEILTPGWREKVEQAWQSNTTRLRYGYVWNWTAQDRPDVVFHADKISGRFTHRWKAPVHEVLVPTVPEHVATVDSVLIEHRADNTKSRKQYLGLLELATQEDPNDDRNAHYLGREYYFYRQYGKAIIELHRHLSLPKATWKPERAASMRYIAKCHECLRDTQAAQEWYIRAALEDPASREALVDAGRYALAQNDFHAAVSYCLRALAIPAESTDYMIERYARAEGPHDLLAVAYSHLEQYDKAVEHATVACCHNPSDSRLMNNLATMKAKLHDNG